MIILWILLGIVALVLIVVVHELGHFVAAKLSGVRVEEFFVGFGPKIWSTKRGKTEYGFKWIPAGGYVKIAGMDPNEEIKPEDLPHTYKGVSKWKRFFIIVSGSAVHIILAIIIAFMAIWLIGLPDPNDATATVASVGQTLDNGNPTPAAQAGLQPGDTIVALNGSPVSDWNAVSDFIHTHADQQVTLEIQRNGRDITLTATLTDVNGTGFLGISPVPIINHYTFIGSLGRTGRWLGEASYGVVYGFYRVFNLSILKQLVGISPPTNERPVSIVGISRLAGEFAHQGLLQLLTFISFLLLFLGYINLLPLPPLDGGHLLVLGVEAVSSKEIDMRKLYPVAVVVIAIFALLFILTLRLDIFNPIKLP